MTERADIIIVGGGMAGASLAFALSGHASVLLLEAEEMPGRHATGRSAAFYAETYGGPGVQPLTTASKAFLTSPPAGFADVPLLHGRGALHVTAPDRRAALRGFAASFSGAAPFLQTLSPEEVRKTVPILRADWAEAGLWEAGCRDIDVAALHAAYLRQAKRGGTRLVVNAALESAVRGDGIWRVSTAAGSFEAPVLVNAAGAWADDVAARTGTAPVGVRPLRRTMVAAELDRPVGADWPLTVDAAGELYFKPDAGLLWISPHDETPCDPGDVQPEEIDIAIAVDRFERATTAKVRRVVRSWAGLRSFTPDRLPVYGFDPSSEDFFWCAGQGGFGIQTAPAGAALAASLLTGGAVSPPPVDPDIYAAARFR
ncbi:NAD(P)/FAD-dependent oxidoreductase [Pacificimonas flava]|uniref:FAD dependent oxidoreductase n=1 Tax=Pacificimonas flava TaxID=1234595 RepID=M2U5F7_9SPHN|nr:FAD-binding oxidoreductase [Pacificimonas flava]EMD83233.1 FAD dependent oxidoreductase [Pacificimonas flava]MBB5279203.1 D-arginine dehydrogenase [Pacificimonas flava]